MTLHIELRGKTEEIDVDIPVSGVELLKSMNLHPDSVIIIVDGRPVPYDEMITSSDIKIINVASGG